MATSRTTRRDRVIRYIFGLFWALSAVGCAEDSAPVDTGVEATRDAGDSGVRLDSGADGGNTDAAPDAGSIDSGVADAGSDAPDGGPADGGADAGTLDECQVALGVPCATFAEGYLKASNAEMSDRFGWRVALSGDGNTLAVGARDEGSNATGVNGNQANNSGRESGAVYIFIRSGATWTQQAYLKASNTGVGDYFGWSVALSGDGNTLVVGAQNEDSGTRGVNGGQANNSAQDSGAVYVFVRGGTTWSQQAYLKASNTDIDDHFGASVAISGDGDTIAVGAYGEGSSATGVNGDQADNQAIRSGAVYVFIRSGTTWTQQAYLKASNTGLGDQFGGSLALSGDGGTLAVGAIWEASDATGVNGDQADDSAQQSGAVYVFRRADMTWSQEAYLKASNTATEDQFGASVALSADGNTLAAGAYGEDSGVNGDQADNSADGSGAVYIFVRGGTTWSQEAYLKASSPGGGDLFGDSVALSDEGDTLAVAAGFEDSGAPGVNGDQADNSADGSGAVYLFTRTSTTWRQRAYLKASNPDAGDHFSWSVALSGNANTLAGSAVFEDSGATGVNGDQADNSATDSGAVYVRRIAP